MSSSSLKRDPEESLADRRKRLKAHAEAHFKSTRAAWADLPPDALRLVVKRRGRRRLERAGGARGRVRAPRVARRGARAPVRARRRATSPATSTSDAVTPGTAATGTGGRSSTSTCATARASRTRRWTRCSSTTRGGARRRSRASSRRTSTTTVKGPTVPEKPARTAREASPSTVWFVCWNARRSRSVPSRSIAVTYAPESSVSVFRALCSRTERRASRSPFATRPGCSPTSRPSSRPPECPS